MTGSDVPRRPIGKLTVLILGNVLLTFMISALMPATGAIAEHFRGLGDSALRAQVVLLAPDAALIFAAPLSGMLIERAGRRWPLLAAIALYTLAGSAGLVIEGFWPLVLSRVVLGGTVGAISTICMTLTGDYFTGTRRTWAVALVGIAPAVGSVLVLLIGGMLVDRGGWHMAFAVYLAGLPVLLLGAVFIEEPARRVLHTAAGGALPPLFWVLCLVAMGEACAAVLPAVQLPFVLIDNGVRDATTASILIAASSAVAVAMGAFYPIMRRHLSVDAVLTMMLGTAAIAYVGLSMATGTISIGVALLLVGLPVGLMVPHFSAVAIERASEEARGRAVGLVTGSIFLGQLLIPFVSEPVRAAVGTEHMFAAFALVLALATVAGVLAPRLRRGLTHATN